MANEPTSPKPGEPGHCGPAPGTPARDIVGTWDRCPECQKREDDLLSGVVLLKRTDYGEAEEQARFGRSLR